MGRPEEREGEGTAAGHRIVTTHTTLINFADLYGHGRWLPQTVMIVTLRITDQITNIIIKS